MHKKSVRSLVMILVVLIVYLFTNINVYAANPLSQVKKRTFGEYKVNSGVNHNQTSSNTGYSDKENDPPNANYDLYFNIKNPSNSAYNKQTSYKDEYGNGAYSTHMFIDDSYSNYYHIYSDGTKKDGINVVTYVDEMSKGSDINFALVRFVIHNDNNIAKTVRLATTADIMIGADDNAPAQDKYLRDKSGILRPSGFYTTNNKCTEESADNKITLNYYFKNDYYIDQVSKNTNYKVNYNVVNWQQRFNKEVMQRNWSNGEFNKINFSRPHSGYTAGGADSAFVANWVVNVPAHGTATVAYAFEVTEAKSEFTVKYDANGGKGSIANQTAEYNEKISLSNNLDANNKQYMTKDNYKLIGWNNVKESADKGEKNYELGDSLIVTQDTTLYAVWEAYKLKLKYDANGGYFQSDATTEQTIAAESSESLSYTEPARTGYDFKGWTNSSSWSDSATKYTNASGSKKGKDWASTFGSDVTSSDAEVTLYAQWEKNITHTFYYFNGQSATASVIFHNGDTSKTMTIPDAARSTDKTYDGHSDWDFRGFSSETAWNSELDIGKDTTQLTISNSDSNSTYYAQYQRTTTITYVDYGDDAKQTNIQQETAYLNYNGGSVYSPEFKAITQNTMKYTENSVNGTKKETWSAIGWTTSTAQNAAAEKQAGDSIISHKDITYYGLYKKDVTLTYNPNGGTLSKKSDSYTRYANASNVAEATKQTYTMPTPSWKENSVTKYSLGGWTYGGNINNYSGYSANSNFYGKLVGTNNGDSNAAKFEYTPRVSDTIYASWTNQTAQTAYEPKVNVIKSVRWKNPSSDNSSVDYDGLQNIDTDGKAIVTLDITVTNTNGYNVSNFKVDDFINTDMWAYKYNVSTNGGVTYVNYSNGGIHIELPSTNSSATYKVEYEIQLNEAYWNVIEDTKLYTNKIPDLNKYLNSLTNKDAYSKNDATKNYNSATGIVDYSNMYYCESTEAEKSYVRATYHIKNGSLRGTERQVRYATPYVVMRQVNWIPTIANQGKDNVQVTLKRVDNEPKTIFDSNAITSNDNKYVKVTYDSTNTMNKTGNVKVTLDPEDKNVLGHLQLTIRVYDNVGNWTEKTYDLYVFCLTGAVEITDSLPDYSIRQYSLNRFRNGEMGVVKVSAGGYADRVTVDFGTYLDKLYKNEYDNYRGIFANDNSTTINGDYPNTDAKDISGTDQDSTMTYLPYNLQVNTWGYTSDTLGGIELKEINTKKTTTTIDNTALRGCLDELIERYQGIKNGKTYPVKEGSIGSVKYAIVGSTLYTYPVMNGNTVRSYADKYELGGETYYNEILYPAYITLDGTKGIDIIYNTVEADNTKMSASVEAATEISLTNWIAVGDSYFKPFKHYFYMPLGANKKTSSDPYYVTLTEYKDSEKAFKHSVSIKLSFTNDNGTSIINDIKTYIKDN